MGIKSITINLNNSYNDQPIILCVETLGAFKRLVHDFKHGHLTYIDYKRQMDLLKSEMHPEVVIFLYDYVAS